MGAKILYIVPPSEGDRAVVGDILRASGHSLDEAGGIEAALDAMEPVPELVLLDGSVGGSAVALYESLRAQTLLKDTPILILIRESDDSSLDQRVDSGICDVIRKPVLPAELASRVRVMLHVRSLIEEVKKGRALFEAMSITDALTGLANARYLFKRLDEEILRCQRFKLPLSCLLTRIDGFEGLAGRPEEGFKDRVIRHVAGLLDHLLRRIDLLSCYDESSFCALLPATGLYHAGLAAEKLRMGVEMSSLKIQGGEFSCTVSTGVATYPDCGETAEDILRAAAEALGRAASLGENRIAVAPATGK